MSAPGAPGGGSPDRSGPGQAIGVDVGGSKIRGVVLDGGFALRADLTVPTPALADEILDAIAHVATTLDEGRDLPVGVGVPGLVTDDGELCFAPNLHPGKGVRFADAISQRLGGKAVAVDNDATCAIRAEHTAGAARGATDAVLVTLGTGIGGGIVANGRIVNGAEHFAGEVGHMVVDPHGPQCPCGRNGCWERYASGSGLGRLGRESAMAGRAPRLVELAGGDPEAVRGEHVAQAAAAGEREAIEVVERFGWWVALGLANLACILDPEVIVMSGGVLESAPRWLEPTRAAFADLLEGAAHRRVPPILPAAFGTAAGAVGAALLAVPTLGCT